MFLRRVSLFALHQTVIVLVGPSLCWETRWNHGMLRKSLQIATHPSKRADPGGDTPNLTFNDENVFIFEAVSKVGPTVE